MARVKGLDANNGVRVGLRLCRKNGADGEVIDRQVLGYGKLGGVVSGEAKDGFGTDNLAGCGGGKVGLADVEAQTEKGGVVGPIIENDISFSLCAGFERFNEVAGEVRFVADLDPGRTTIDSSLKDALQRMAVEMTGIQDWIEKHYS